MGKDICDAPSLRESPRQEREPSCADWIERDQKITLNDFHRRAVEVLVSAMRTGVYNLPINWKKVDWSYGGGVRFVMRTGGLSTYDFGHLTQLVFAAHDACVRVLIEPCTFRHLAITMHAREREATSFYARHPTIEQALETWRASPGNRKDGSSQQDNPGASQ